MARLPFPDARDPISVQRNVDAVVELTGAGASVTATGPVGAIVAKVPLRDVNGAVVGYLPVYATIT